MSQDKPVSDQERTEAERKQRKRALEFFGNFPIISIENALIFATQEVSRAVAAEREACAKAMCMYCRCENYPAVKKNEVGLWYHDVGSHGVKCAAAAIHSRTEKEETK